MELSLIERHVEEWAKEHAQLLGLDRSAVEARYIYNPGGFVNQSFRLTDGRTARHVKLAPAPKVHRLQKWASVSGHLADNYNAPRLVSQIDRELVPGYPYGLVFEFAKGEPLGTSGNESAVMAEVFSTITRLHHDQALKASIPAGSPRTYADAFIDEYIARFKEDLITIDSAKDLLDFVPQRDFGWFHDETRRLEETVVRTPAFQEHAGDVTHNDLNWQNILVASDSGFRIIDWDDLSGSGDAAMDYSVLLWPLRGTKEWPDWKNRIAAAAGSGVLERFDLYLRAKLLDDVIDILADYIEVESRPEFKERTQERARDTHLRAFAEYRQKYGYV